MTTLVYTRKEAAEQLNVGLPLLDAWLKRAQRPLPHLRERQERTMGYTSIPEDLPARRDRR